MRHQAGDYKTGRAYGERPPLVIAPAIYPEVGFSRLRSETLSGSIAEGYAGSASPSKSSMLHRRMLAGSHGHVEVCGMSKLVEAERLEGCAACPAQLEAFLGHWRAFLQPQHGLVFSQLNGAPLSVQVGNPSHEPEFLLRCACSMMLSLMLRVSVVASAGFCAHSCLQHAHPWAPCTAVLGRRSQEQGEAFVYRSRCVCVRTGPGEAVLHKRVPHCGQEDQPAPRARHGRHPPAASKPWQIPPCMRAASCSSVRMPAA